MYTLNTLFKFPDKEEIIRVHRTDGRRRILPDTVQMKYNVKSPVLAISRKTK